jgi:predicted acylesterase/phospholipase RssA
MDLTRMDALRTDLPVSLVLGAGGVRGLAHVGVIETLEARGYRVTEMVGTSVGALIIAFYAAVGMDAADLREVGLGLTSRHLLAWAWLRRAPAAIRDRFRHRAGPIPDSLDRLADATWAPLRHGVERIGLLAYDRATGDAVLAHSEQAEIPLPAAARGAAALPGLFPPFRCEVGGRVLRLSDGGEADRLPVGVLFSTPFRPVQILAVDISNSPGMRAYNLRKLAALAREHPGIPIAVACPETIGHGTVLYTGERLEALIASGRQSTEDALRGTAL